MAEEKTKHQSELSALERKLKESFVLVRLCWGCFLCGIVFEISRPLKEEVAESLVTLKS